MSLVSCGGSGDESSGSSTEVGALPEGVDQQIRDLMKQGDVPSLSAAIVVNSELLWAKNYEGTAGLDTV